jgi:hypothetical protein
MEHRCRSGGCGGGSDGTLVSFAMGAGGGSLVGQADRDVTGGGVDLGEQGPGDAGYAAGRDRPGEPALGDDAAGLADGDAREGVVLAGPQ